jgi:hypothetical protein
VRGDANGRAVSSVLAISEIISTPGRPRAASPRRPTARRRMRATLEPRERRPVRDAPLRVALEERRRLLEYQQIRSSGASRRVRDGHFVRVEDVVDNLSALPWRARARRNRPSSAQSDRPGRRPEARAESNGLCEASA